MSSCGALIYRPAFTYLLSIVEPIIITVRSVAGIPRRRTEIGGPEPRSPATLWGRWDFAESQMPAPNGERSRAEAVEIGRLEILPERPSPAKAVRRAWDVRSEPIVDSDDLGNGFSYDVALYNCTYTTFNRLTVTCRRVRHVNVRVLRVGKTCVKDVNSGLQLWSRRRETYVGFKKLADVTSSR